jgi:plasmid stabilization system protein ParE
VRRLDVVIPQDVQQQILDQVDYIACDSVDNALAWEDRLRRAINRIGDSPGHVVDAGASRRVGETIHKLVFEKTYLIHYRINDTAGAVEIVNFRHGARLPRWGEP